MTTSYRSSAAGPLAGFTWQKRRALLALLRLRGDGVVELEGHDDIAVLNLNGEIITAIQTKHSFLNETMTTNSVELWKTLRVWCAIVRKASPGARFLLATTATVDSLLAPFREDSSSPPTTAEIGLLETALSQAAIAKGNKDLTESYKSWETLLPTQRQAILANFRIADNSPRLAQVDQDIAAELVHRLSLRPERLAHTLLQVLGWFESEVASPLGISGCRFTAEELFKVLESFRDKAMPTSIAFWHEADEYTDTEIASERLRDPIYLKQLELLEANDEECMVALIHVLKARSERQDIRNSGFSGNQDLGRFDAQLATKWKLFQLKHLRDSDESVAKEKRACAIGWKIHNSCMEFQAGIGTPQVLAPPHMCCGSYHLLADDLKIGWHPEFDSRCQKRTKAA